MMFTAGYAEFGRFQGAPIRWHWSLLAALFVLGADWDAGDVVRPLRWVLLLGLLLLHGAGHHVMVQHFRLRRVGVDLQVSGAETRWLGDATPRQEIAIAWAGVFAQLVALVVVLLGFAIYRAAGGLATEWWMDDIVHVYVWVNLGLMGVNLLPLPTFDGDVAWKIVDLWRGTLESHRVIIIHVARDDGDAPVDPERVRREVDAELDALTQAHNQRAEASTPK